MLVLERLMLPGSLLLEFALPGFRSVAFTPLFF